MSEHHDIAPKDFSAPRSAFLIVLLFAFLALTRILAPSDLHEGDQPKQADYVLDIVCNGNWTVQHHADGSIMSKPPLYNWIAAPFVMLFGPEDVFLKMPSLLAGLAAALMVWDMARRRFGERAALWGTALMLMTSMYAKQMYYARTDMLLTCFIVMQFWAIVRWEDSGSGKSSYQSGWIWLFWIAAALGNLTKGPLAFLPHLALIALWLFEGRCKQRYARLGVEWGLPLALTPFLIWFACAYRLEGYPLFEHMFLAEVFARFQSVADKIALKGADRSNRNFFYYVPHILSRTLPSSLLALIGLWVAFTAKKNAELNERQRGMLYFLVAWFFTTLLFFSVIPSKRADRIFPAIPAFCLLAGFAFEGCLQAIRGRADVRLEYAIGRWITFAIAAVLGVASAGLIAFEMGANVGPFMMLRRKLPAMTLENLETQRTLVLICAGAIVLCATSAIILFARNRAHLFMWCLLGCKLIVVVLYQHTFGDWMQTDFCRGAAPLCRAVRAAARAEKLPIMIIAGSGPAARFYLLQAGLETPAKVAKAKLEQPHAAMYVVGTAQPSKKAKDVVRGGLDGAGLGGEALVKVDGVPNVDTTDSKVPAMPWLGAVRLQARE